MSGRDPIAIVTGSFRRRDGQHQVSLRYERGEGPPSITSPEDFPEGRRVVVTGGRTIQDFSR